MLAAPLFARLSDEDLLAEASRLVKCERAATTALLQSLMEIDTRRLYLRGGCSSLFTYCTQVLHLAEGAAYNRIEAARAAKRFPLILEALTSGSVTLTTVRLLAPHLTNDNHRELLAAARHKSKREIELLVATLRPKPLVETVIRKLPTQREPSDTPPSGVAPPTTVDGQTGSSAPHTSPDQPEVKLQQSAGGPVNADLGNRDLSIGRSILSPLSAAHYKLQLTISSDTHDKLRRAQDLLRHTTPAGDVAVVIDRALTLLVADLERRRCAATPAPRANAGGIASGRHIPAAVKRLVWQRDHGRCAFVGIAGRCRETGFLEFHHVEPYAEGGRAIVENIQLRCRAHNLYEASLFFGSGAERVRESAPAGW